MMRRLLFLILGLVLVYLVVAYLALPWAWTVRTRRHPDLSAGPRFTHTAEGLPGDPLNIALVGSDQDVVRAMTASGWRPADPITFQTSLRVIERTLLKEPDETAPVSHLFLFGRKQDLAFEQPVGASPRQRHHVRFWRAELIDQDPPLWLGAATYDTSVGVSHRTGQVTHHIAADLDTERDRCVADLTRTGAAEEVYYVERFHDRLEGRNGGGDPWHTDGRLVVVVLAPTPVAPR
jgi:hypothetical protein